MAQHQTGTQHRVAVDRDILDLAEIFLGNRRKQLTVGRAAAAQQDVDALRRMGHELKGTAGSYGFAELATLGASLERAAVEGDFPGVERLLDRMSSFLDQVVIEPR